MHTNLLFEGDASAARAPITYTLVIQKGKQ